MAEDEAQEKTEEPTSRRKREARRKGEVAQSQEVSTLFILVGAVFTFKAFGGWMMRHIKGYLHDSIATLDMELTAASTPVLFELYIYKMLVILFPLLIVLLTMTFLASYIQYGWLWSTKSLKLNWNVVNIGSGLKKLAPSIENMKNLGKSFIKILLLLTISYFTIRSEMDAFMNLIDVSVEQIFAFVAGMTMKLIMNILYIYVFFAIADFAITKFLHHKKLKMSKSEVKDEHR
ncbi:MAG: EscU/YscU/HrcU family type III secretion system export apparatus switch protein, partial [Candidatus Cloacimonetes bacterium]|nr:EscU/YscU/HrcU family type III secretion system export apparatus switch protein [Candidatus Cloacimonadota bacterium]